MSSFFVNILCACSVCGGSLPFDIFNRYQTKDINNFLSLFLPEEMQSDEGVEEQRRRWEVESKANRSRIDYFAKLQSHWWHCIIMCVLVLYIHRVNRTDLHGFHNLIQLSGNVEMLMSNIICSPRGSIYALVMIPYPTPCTSCAVRCRSIYWKFPLFTIVTCVSTKQTATVDRFGRLLYYWCSYNYWCCCRISSYWFANGLT